MGNMFIKRRLFEALKGHLQKKEISLIVGPRQVGKTTMMLQLERELKRQGMATLFLNLDREGDKRHFASQENLIQKIRLEFGSKEGFVFIDEMQRKENAGLFLKGIYDSNLPYKLIVSGSGSLELKEKIQESLVGRKKIFELQPVLFEEFVNYRTEYRYEDNLAEFFEVESEKRELLLREYLNFGGYPRVVLADTEEEKRETIDEIFHSYLEKDISYLLRVEKIDAFFNLVRLLSSQIGRMVNYSKIAGELNISIQTLKNYLWYGEKTFVLQRVSPYFKNARKEIVKSPVYYFFDLGLRNYGIGRFGSLVDYGPVFENFILNVIKERIRWSGSTVHFWRTKDKAEVDFVINTGEDVIPVEVKHRKLAKPTVERSMRSFIGKYSPKTAVVVNLALNERVMIGETDVRFVPFWKIGKIV